MFDRETADRIADDFTPDEVEQRLAAIESEISTLRHEQLGLLHQADVGQMATADGCRSLQEWAAARLDVTPESARDLVCATRSITPALNGRLASGEITFDRAVATTRLATTGAGPDVMEASAGHDLNGVRRLAARHKRMTPLEESEIFDAQTFVIQPSLDEAHWRLFGVLAGLEGRTVAQAIQDRADVLRSAPGDPQLPSDHRRALALVTICQDSLEGLVTESTSREPVVTVAVDAALAGATGGETGAEIVGGPRIGPRALEELLCTGRIEWNRHETDGSITPLGETTTAISPRLRRAILARDGGCVIDGCQSLYRLQAHHIVPRSQNGTNHPTNLGTFCWWHHIVAIHRMGMIIDPDTPPQRRRLLRPRDGPEPG